MITKILDNGNTIRLVNEDKLDDNSTVIYDLEKTSGIKIKYLEKEDYINIWDEARRMFFTVKHSEVLEPYSSDTLDLYNKIIGYLNTGISVGIKDDKGKPVNLDTKNTENKLNSIAEQLEDVKNLLKLILS